MTGAITLSLQSGLTFRQPTKLLRPRPSYVQSFSLTLKAFHSHSYFCPYKSLSTAICGYSKLDDEFPEEIGEVFFEDNDIIEDESDEDEETESSIDLLVRFLHSMFKKLSRRAKKACRSILPSAISPQLVNFAVDGFLLLAGLSVIKALLEVVCTLGSTVFAVILLLRVVWAAISYFQSSGNTFNQGGNSYGTTQPVG